MNAEIMSASGVGLEITNLLMPFISALMLLVITLWFKDFATNLMSGLKFKMNSAFNEGDHIILDGGDAIIVKIGLRETVFGVYSDKGYVWEFVSNDRLKFHKIQKIVNTNLHLDSEAEQGRRLQHLIDKHQNAKIGENADKIKANKEEIEQLKRKK